MKRCMHRVKHIFGKNKKLFIIGTPLLLLVIFFVFGQGGKNAEPYMVGRVNLEQSAVLSGQVKTSDRADLGFAASGRVARILVKNNEQVREGQILAQLEIGDLLADLKIKQAETLQEDIKVNNAYRALISNGLEFIPDSSDYDITPPSVSGIYDGPEGVYKIVIAKKNVTFPDFFIRTFDLEKTERIIEKNSPTPLGTKGLYIAFADDDVSPYLDTIWYLEIPNKSSSIYLENYNEYLAAKNNRDLTIDEAEIQKINSEIRKNTIYAPFEGIVSNIEREVGENASVGERVISILGEDTLEVVLQVSELDVSRLAPGSQIKVSLDAFPGEEFLGTLKTINSRETEIDGVPVYEAFVELPADGRVKTGMSASGTITIATKSDVLAVPSYFVKKIGDRNIVEVVSPGGDISEREVKLGLLGTDSLVEIISGLEEGEKIVAVSQK